MSIKAESIFIGITSMEMEVNTSDYVHATVQPINATDREICWESSKEEIVSINLITGQFHANKVGDATITAFLYSDPSIKKSFDIHVKGYIPVESISFPTPDFQIDVNDKKDLIITALPSNATNPKITWRSACPDIASVSQTGEITANSPGIVDIYATAENGSVSAKCEVWVRGKTPVFLIHGRTSHSNATWGIKTNIPSGANNDFNSSINAEFSIDKKYIDVNWQKVIDVVQGDSSNDDKPCNLGYELQNAGYKKNVNLFAFNYPNEDAVKYSAEKFAAYINNLISYVITYGSNEMKACFYASRNDYNNNNYKINIVGHSMGGLVARYFIENLYQDTHVNKLITICTPHWGSPLADLSNDIGILHLLCDHDLDVNSAMYGGSNSTTVNCNKGSCPGSNYTVTPTLQYQRQRSTKYYAIAGISYDSDGMSDNNFDFELQNNSENLAELNTEIIQRSQNKLYVLTNMDGVEMRVQFNAAYVRDNVVGFLSQIGWGSLNETGSPTKKINFKKILVNIDTDGGNSLTNHFHGKMPHRIDVINKVIEYLEE